LEDDRHFAASQTNWGKIAQDKAQSTIARLCPQFELFNANNYYVVSCCKYVHFAAFF